jgi:hypothetical protein
MGISAGQTAQGAYAAAVGSIAGLTSQGNYAIAMGREAGRANQGSYAISVGTTAGYSNQGDYAVAVGQGAAYTGQDGFTTAIGADAGYSNQGSSSVAIGASAGYDKQSSWSVAVGRDSGTYSQGTESTAVGYLSADRNQSAYGTAIGSLAGRCNQGEGSTAVGRAAGAYNQGFNAVAVGNSAGYVAQGTSAVAVGNEAGRNNQSSYATALGPYAGSNNQTYGATAVGYEAAQTSQGSSAVAVGHQAGRSYQSNFAVAVGVLAGETSQRAYAVAVGSEAGRYNQSDFAVAIGLYAGAESQGGLSIGMGAYAGRYSQGCYSVALGYDAGRDNQGNYCVGIGYRAGFNTIHDRTICINASGADMNTQGADRAYIRPIRGGNITASALAYTSAGEIVEETNVNIDASGRVGIGTASPSEILHVQSANIANVVISSTGENNDVGLFFRTPFNSTSPPKCALIASGGNFSGYNGQLDICFDTTNNNDSVYRATPAKSKVTFKADGKVGIGLTDPGALLHINKSGGNSLILLGGITASEATAPLSIRDSSNQQIHFYYHTTKVGSITSDNVSTAFNTSSDYRLKENITPMSNAMSIINNLKPVHYTFKSYPGNVKYGFIAHEVSEAGCDFAVHGSKDAVKSFGNIINTYNEIITENVIEPDTLNENETWVKTEERPEYQQLDVSKLIPHLTCAFQELYSELQAEKAKVATLETQLASVLARLDALESA